MEDLQFVSSKTYQNNGNLDVLQYLTHPGKVLDIGCGAGDNARILKDKGFTVDGITISNDELKQASPFLQQGYLYDLENGLPEEINRADYDYIICSHVLEHICYPDKLLSHIKTCLKTNGKLIVALPNLFHYTSRWRLIKGDFIYQEAGVWDNTHFKWYTYSTGKALLEKHGFNLIQQTVTGHVPGYSFFSKFLSAGLEKALYSLFAKVSPGLFGYQLIYVATK